MRKLFLALAGVAAALLLVPAFAADEKKPVDKPAEPKKDDKKEVKLEGELKCGKCLLKETDECSNVLEVKEKDKTVNYYLKDKGKKEDYHACTKAAKVTVTGTVTEKDGKKWVEVTKVEAAKKEEKKDGDK